ncbi:MAG: D-alanine--D-alanine ligase [Rikenellaceae bacterium]
MEKLKIALLSGGCSSEREIALKSAAQIAESLDTSRYDIKVIDVKGREWIHTDSNAQEWKMNLNDFTLTIAKECHTFDCALIIIHGTPGEDGMVQGYLEMMGVPYCSSSMTSSVITFDKITTKRTVSHIEGLNLAREILFTKGEQIDPEKIVEKLGLPLFIKPNASGSSFGVSKVKHLSEITDAIQAALAESDTVLIEEAISGREFGCGVLITSDKEILLPITEICSKREFFDYEAKYMSGLSEEITPAQIPDSLRDKIQSLAASAYRACRCRGIVRIDFIVTESNEPYLIEINSIPGLSSASIIPQQARAAGMTIGELFSISIDSIIK